MSERIVPLAAMEKIIKNAGAERVSDPSKVALKEGKIAFAPWCGSKESEEKFKEVANGKSLNSPFNQPAITGKKCFITGDDAKYWFYFGRSH